jgi:primosomal protein N' (replication factor Y)
MIGKIAVSAATFAIDKPYSYAIAENMELQPGQRVMVPFGRGNRRCEGVVLSVEEGSAQGLKAIEQVLDEVIFLQNGHVLLQKKVDQIREENGKSVDELFREVFRW